MKSARAGTSRCLAIAGSAAIAHLILARGTELSPDEAYYLAAARTTRAIADHPPLLLWLLALADRLPFESVELRVRIVPVLLSLLTTLVCVAVARRHGASVAGAEMAAWATSWTPLAMAGGFVATPDAPLLLGVALAVGCAGPERARPWIAFAALFAACGAKVSALPIAFAIAVAASDRWTRLAASAAVATSLPVWAPTIAFQLRHAFASPPTAWSIGGMLGAVALAALAQAVFWSPWLLSRGTRMLREGPAVDRAVVVVLSGLVLASAMIRATPPEPNWWAPAGLLVAVASARAAWSRRARVLALALWLVPTTAAAAHAVHPFLPLSRAQDPTARLHGWRPGEDEPLDAPGLGAYGPAAERCVYRQKCGSFLEYLQIDEH